MLKKMTIYEFARRYFPETFGIMTGPQKIMLKKIVEPPKEKAIIWPGGMAGKKSMQKIVTGFLNNDIRI